MLDDLYFTNVLGGAAAPKLLSIPTRTTAGGVYMAKLGDYMFSLDTSAFQQLQRDTAFRWASIKRIGREPAQQFTGIDDDTISLDGVIYPHFRGGLSQVSQMRAAAARGEALPLIYAFDSVGQYCGLWCIKNVREGRTVFMRDGTPRKIEFSLQLVYYGEDAAGPGATVSANLAKPTTASALAVPPQLGASGSGLLGSALSIPGLPAIDASSAAVDVRKIAGAIGTVAGAAGKIANTVRAVTSGSIGSMVAGAMTLLPPEVRAAASEIVKATIAVKTAERDVSAATTVFAESPSGLKRTGVDYGVLMKDIARGAVMNGGTVKSGAAQLAAMPKTAGVSDLDRLSAAAGLGNIAMHADHLIFAATEAAAQVEKIIGRIDG